MKKAILILLFASLNVVLIESCADDDNGSGRDFLDNDANDADRSLDNDGDSFQDMDLNDADGSLDSDDGGLDNDMSDPDRGLDMDDTRDSDPDRTVSP